MQRLLLLLLLCTAMCIGCHHTADAVDIHGNNIYLDELKGKWVVVNYWATWCAPCLTELPHFEKFQQQHKDNVVVIGVSFDGWSNEKINAFTKKHKINFAMTNQFPIENFGITEISNLPMTFIINPQGKLQKTLLGPQTEITLAKATVKQPHENL